MRRLLTGIVLSLACAAPAQAGHITFGSTLRAKANRTQAAPVDSVYWNAALGSGGRVRVPHRGQIVGMRLKGRVPVVGGTPPDVVMLLQALRPAGGGRTRVVLTSGTLKIPFGGARNRITTYDDRDIVNLCVHKGDSVGLATSGGFGAAYPNGAAFAMFGAVPGSTIDAFTGAGMDMNGSVFEAHPQRGEELLMRLRLATGKAAGLCR